MVVAGVASPVLEAGPEGAEDAVVFLHGNPGSGGDWRELLEEVGHFARAVAPDLPGYGEADKPRGFDYSLLGYARHIGGLLDELGIRRAHLVLHDFGGPWGLEWALDNPRAVASVTLLGIGVFPEFRWHRWARIWRTPVIGELMQYTTPQAMGRLIMGAENRNLTTDQVGRLVRLMSPWGTRRAILAAYRAAPRAVMESRMTRSGPAPRVELLNQRLGHVPALVIWPTSDPYVGYQPEYQRRAFPSARVEIIEGAGHWLHWEQPEQVAALILQFLGAQTARAPGDDTSSAALAGGSSPAAGPTWGASARRPRDSAGSAVAAEDH